MPATQTGAATALNQEPPPQPQRDGLVLTPHVHSGAWSELMWDQPYSEYVAPDTIPQEALGLCSWELRNS